jgi:hypothetical protein
MNALCAGICARRNPPAASLGTILLNVPWETSYLFSYENKARDCSHSPRARFRAHLKFAQAQGVESAETTAGGAGA